LTRFEPTNLTLPAPAVSGGRSTIGLATAEHRPDDPGELVGQGCDGGIEWPTREQPIDPGPQPALATLGQDRDRAGAMHHLPSQVAVAPLADPEQSVLAARRVLPRRQAEPCGKTPPARERSPIAYGRHYAASDDWPYAWDIGEPPAGGVLPCQAAESRIQRRYPLLRRSQVGHLQG
jgi:hypothetical protein